MTTLEDRLAEDLRAAVDGVEPPGDFATSWPARVAARKARRRTSRLAGVAAVLATAGLIGGLVAVRDDPGGKTVVPASDPETSAEPTPVEPTPVEPDPSAGVGWTRLAQSPLSPRSAAGAAWTGKEYIVWGGVDQSRLDAVRSDGAAYNLATDEWRLLPSAPLDGRASPAVIWTGFKLIVWGGTEDGHTVLPSKSAHDGALYDPSSDTWTGMAPFPLDGRAMGDAAIVWTGAEMIVWGGGWKVDHGAAYNPDTNTWRPLPAAPIEGRNLVAGAWTGTEMVVWGGARFDGADGNRTFTRNQGDGAAYNPETDTWRVLPESLLAPAVVDAIWTGTEVLFSPGYSGDPTANGVMAEGRGSAYDPATDTWRQVDTIPPHPGTALVMAGDVPLAFAKGSVIDLRDGTATEPGLSDVSSAAWTGAELLIHPTSGGGLLAYRPASSAPMPPPCPVPEAPTGWEYSTPTSSPNAMGATVAWTGSQFLVWDTTTLFVGAGTAYDAATDTWTAIAPPPFVVGQPTQQLWTGSELLLWYVTGGAAYNPATGSWRPLATGVSDDRVFWTGSEVLRWHSTSSTTNGQSATLLAAGPDAATWRTLPSFSGTSKSAVWTGTHLMVSDRAYGQLRVATFDPATETWTTSSPSPFNIEYSDAVWTGTEVVYLGGAHGAAYNPTTDTWRQLGETPQHPATEAWWTGTHVLMLIKGGYYLYDPVTDEVSEKVQPGVTLIAGSAPGNGTMAFLAEVMGTECTTQTLVATLDLDG